MKIWNSRESKRIFIIKHPSVGKTPIPKLVCNDKDRGLLELTWKRLRMPDVNGWLSLLIYTP